eukprot:1164151-Prymnesium_polylepis.1
MRFFSFLRWRRSELRRGGLVARARDKAEHAPVGAILRLFSWLPSDDRGHVCVDRCSCSPNKVNGEGVSRDHAGGAKEHRPANSAQNLNVNPPTPTRITMLGAVTARAESAVWS